MSNKRMALSFYHHHRSSCEASLKSNIRYGDKRYQPDEATTAIWEFLKMLPAWDKVARLDSNEGSHLLCSGAVNLMRYIQFYHTHRSEYIANHPRQPFKLQYIFKELASYIEHEYDIQEKEGMAIVYSLLNSEIEKAARSDFLEDSSRFPPGSSIDPKFLLNIIDVVIAYLGDPPYSIVDLGWAGVENIHYARALAGEDHTGFFAWPFSGEEL